MSATYACLPRSAVQAFVNMCPTCSMQKLQQNCDPLKPIIIVSGFMSRGQVCLVDDYMHIVHACLFSPAFFF